MEIPSIRDPLCVEGREINLQRVDTKIGASLIGGPKQHDRGVRTWEVMYSVFLEKKTESGHDNRVLSMYTKQGGWLARYRHEPGGMGIKDTSNVGNKITINLHSGFFFKIF